MTNELLQNPESIGMLIAGALTIGIFIYIFIFSVLQVRQIRILQGKVSTDMDNTISITTYIYLVVQIILFVIALIFLSM